MDENAPAIMPQTTGRLLGIDYGSKRVGISVSDPLGMIAQGLTTLNNDSQLIDRICQLVRERTVVRIVVGMPYSQDGGKGAKAQEVDLFIGRLKNRVGVEVETWDESYSSVQAQRALIAGGMKRKKRQQKKRVDEMAARLLLQEYMDHSPTGAAGATRASDGGGV